MKWCVEFVVLYMYLAVVQAVLSVNKALKQVSEAEASAVAVLQALLSDNLDLADVIPANGQYYYDELLRAKKAKEVGTQNMLLCVCVCLLACSYTHASGLLAQFCVCVHTCTLNIANSDKRKILGWAKGPWG